MTDKTLPHRAALTEWVEAQRTLKLADLRETYDDRVKNDATDEDFETWRGGLGTIAFGTNQATGGDIKQLEHLTGRSFPEPLKAFWRDLGELVGSPVHQDLQGGVYSVAKLLAGFAPEVRPYEKLTDIGVVDMMNWVWSNDKDLLTLADGQVIDLGGGAQITPADLASFNRNYTCFGHFMDGYCESHLHLHFDCGGQFGATYWHQDYAPPLQPVINGMDTPEALIMLCLNTYEAIRAEDADDPYFDLDTLAKRLSA